MADEWYSQLVVAYTAAKSEQEISALNQQMEGFISDINNVWPIIRFLSAPNKPINQYIISAGSLRLYINSRSNELHNNPELLTSICQGLKPLIFCNHPVHKQILACFRMLTVLFKVGSSDISIQFLDDFLQNLPSDDPNILASRLSSILFFVSKITLSTVRAGQHNEILTKTHSIISQFFNAALVSSSEGCLVFRYALKIERLVGVAMRAPIDTLQVIFSLIPALLSSPRPDDQCWLRLLWQCARCIDALASFYSTTSGNPPELWEQLFPLSVAMLDHFELCPSKMSYCMTPLDVNYSRVPLDIIPLLCKISTLSESDAADFMDNPAVFAAAAYYSKETTDIRHRAAAFLNLKRHVPLELPPCEQSMYLVAKTMKECHDRVSLNVWISQCIENPQETPVHLATLLFLLSKAVIQVPDPSPYVQIALTCLGSEYPVVNANAATLLARLVKKLKIEVDQQAIYRIIEISQNCPTSGASKALEAIIVNQKCDALIAQVIEVIYNTLSQELAFPDEINWKSVNHLVTVIVLCIQNNSQLLNDNFLAFIEAFMKLQVTDLSAAYSLSAMLECAFSNQIPPSINIMSQFITAIGQNYLYIYAMENLYQPIIRFITVFPMQFIQTGLSGRVLEIAVNMAQTSVNFCDPAADLISWVLQIDHSIDPAPFIALSGDSTLMFSPNNRFEIVATVCVFYPFNPSDEMTESWMEMFKEQPLCPYELKLHAAALSAVSCRMPTRAPVLMPKVLELLSDAVNPESEERRTYCLHEMSSIMESQFAEFVSPAMGLCPQPLSEQLAQLVQSLLASK